ncbi:MAG: gamma-glutamyltransferase [Chiayiivirga sp.]|jgi:gamma-glutamyltranspeptidase/glutathione hydrolase|uniref:gamma-glutamyltransferase n=1 Tax=Chiayiivirga sp. TaxID=2041042 RepID=UPI0025C4DF69|nr:gamma-glutamyltransferase [Chiayiivirga sp.]MCI1711314.1 gamma-glutamyltransferase [Chiayiivirga sp.]MCI1727883.1 gamma-glutamyltransferase [Chiayiivirga sp.]
MIRIPLLLCALLATVPCLGADRITGRADATRSVVYAPHAMAATSHPLATQIALDTMRAGGSAMDAAIAANAALGLMEPTGNGIGGDLFAIVWDPKTKKLHGYNGSGRSPKSLTLEHFRRLGLRDIPPHGPLPVSVPGAVDAWFALHQRFGRRSMAQNLAPTIAYARAGHPVHETIAYYWERSVPVLSKWPGFTEQFTLDGRAPRAGEIWKNPNLARTLEAIARGGRKAFYEGEIARRIDAYFQANEGFLSYADLAAHRGEWVEPVSTTYRGYEVWELPPNGQGIAALQMLNLLEPFDLKSHGFGSAEHLHLVTEAKKLAFADRARWYADPAFAPAPVQTLISKDYARERGKLISMERALREVQPGTPKQLDEGDTIYLTTADADGMMVSLIQSNYRGMGSGMAPPGLGFILQDRGEMFVLQEGHPNGYAPGKRPFHTIIPAFVTKDGQPWLSFGVMGGAMQPQGHVQILVNLIDFGMNLQEAGDAPRLHHDGSTEPTGQNTAMSSGGVLELESGFATETIRALMRKGHVVKFADGPFGGYQAIARDPVTGVYAGASESRKDGQAAGY